MRCYTVVILFSHNTHRHCRAVSLSVVLKQNLPGKKISVKTITLCDVAADFGVVNTLTAVAVAVVGDERTFDAYESPANGTKPAAFDFHVALRL